MTPEERRQFEDMQRRLELLERVENVGFIENVRRRLFAGLTVAELPSIKLSDLSDVSGTDGASTGKVLKKAATTWQPGTDATS